MCLKSWSSHGSNSGGFYNCNAYEETKKKEGASAIEKERAAMVERMRRYEHYFSRYVQQGQGCNEKAVKALNDIAQNFRTKVEGAGLSLIRNMSGAETSFMQDTVNRIIEARRILKWSYCFAFYLPTKEGFPLKNLFEEHQGLIFIFMYFMIVKHVF